MKKIAICDDDINLLSTFKKILSRIGCDVYLSKNERELHDLLSEGDFDVVIVDYNLDPDDFDDIPKNGLEIISEIRNKYNRRDNMKLVLTTSPNCAEIDEVKEAGGDDILMKPFSPLTKITDMLSNLTNGECGIR